MPARNHVRFGHLEVAEREPVTVGPDEPPRLAVVARAIDAVGHYAVRMGATASISRRQGRCRRRQLR
jgi:hypothetical protein